MEFLGDRRAADDVPALQHPHLQPGRGQVGGADQAVVAAADDQDILLLLAHVGYRWVVIAR